MCAREWSVRGCRMLSIQREMGLVREDAVEDKRSLIARKREATTSL